MTAQLKIIDPDDDPGTEVAVDGEQTPISTRVRARLSGFKDWAWVAIVAILAVTWVAGQVLYTLRPAPTNNQPEVQKGTK